MKAVTRLFLIGLILTVGLPLTCAGADDANSSSSAPVAAPAPVTDPGQFADRYRQILAQPAFQDGSEPDLGTRLQDELDQWFRALGARIGNLKYGDRLPAVESLLITLMVVFCAAVVLYVMLRLTRRRARMEAKPEEEMPGRKAYRPPRAYDQEIREAIHNGDWHLAWLAAWRQFLSRLEDRQLVEADRTRTNREYLAQLRARALPASALTLLTGMVDAYDRFIYGRRAIGEAEWTQFRGQINEATLLLHLDEDGSRVGMKVHSP